MLSQFHQDEGFFDAAPKVLNEKETRYEEFNFKIFKSPFQRLQHQKSLLITSRIFFKVDRNNDISNLARNVPLSLMYLFVASKALLVLGVNSE